MEKVAFSITKLRNNGAIKIGSGRGAYLIGEDLLVPLNSREGKAYIKVFENVVKYCHPTPGSNDEFKGVYTEIAECEIDVTDKSGKPTGAKEVRELTIDYLIWYKKDNA